MDFSSDSRLQNSQQGAILPPIPLPLPVNEEQVKGKIAPPLTPFEPKAVHQLTLSLASIVLTQAKRKSPSLLAEHKWEKHASSSLSLTQSPQKQAIQAQIIEKQRIHKQIISAAKEGKWELIPAIDQTENLSPLLLLQSLISALEQRSLEGFKILFPIYISKKKENAFPRQLKKRSLQQELLLLLLQENNLIAARFLIEKCAFSLNLFPTLLCQILKERPSLEALKLLLEEGALIGKKQSQVDVLLYQALSLKLADPYLALLIQHSFKLERDKNKKEKNQNILLDEIYSPLFLLLQQKRFTLVEQLLPQFQEIRPCESWLLWFNAQENKRDRLAAFFEKLQPLIDATDNLGLSALHLACLAGDFQSVAILIANGASLNPRSLKGETPLDCALLSLAQETQATPKGANSIQVIESMINHGGQFSIDTLSLSQWHKLAHQACFYRHLALFKLIANRLSPIETFKSHFHKISLQGTLLHLACHYNALNLVKKLVAKGLQSIELQQDELQKLRPLTKKEWLLQANEYGETALHLACSKGHLELAAFLAQEEPSLLYAPDLEGATPFYLLLKRGEAKKTDFPIDLQAPIGAKEETLLHLAAKEGNLTAITYLLSKNVAIDAKDAQLKTPLHLLCSESADCASLVSVLAKKGAQIDARDIEQETPLHLACFYRRYDIVKELLKNEAAVNCKNKKGQTPLIKILTSKRYLDADDLNCVAFLLEKGAFPFIREENSRMHAALYIQQLCQEAQKLSDPLLLQQIASLLAQLSSLFPDEMKVSELELRLKNGETPHAELFSFLYLKQSSFAFQLALESPLIVHYLLKNDLKNFLKNPLAVDIAHLEQRLLKKGTLAQQAIAELIEGNAKGQFWLAATMRPYFISYLIEYGSSLLPSNFSARLPKNLSPSQQIALLPLMSPPQIQAIVGQHLTVEQSQKLLNQFYPIPTAGTVCARALLKELAQRRLKESWQNDSGAMQELLAYLPPAVFASALQDKELQASIPLYLPLLPYAHQKVMIPLISLSNWIELMQTLPLAQKLAWIKMATLPQKQALLTQPFPFSLAAEKKEVEQLQRQVFQMSQKPFSALYSQAKWQMLLANFSQLKSQIQMQSLSLPVRLNKMQEAFLSGESSPHLQVKVALQMQMLPKKMAYLKKTLDCIEQEVEKLDPLFAENIPLHFQDPLTATLMQDPVSYRCIGNGEKKKIILDRSSLNQVIDAHHQSSNSSQIELPLCPWSRLPIDLSSIREEAELKQAIAHYLLPSLKKSEKPALARSQTKNNLF